LTEYTPLFIIIPLYCFGVWKGTSKLDSYSTENGTLGWKVPPYKPVEPALELLGKPNAGPALRDSKVGSNAKKGGTAELFRPFKEGWKGFFVVL
jgi:hypothetical protein